jgi:crotonobetainyl-CoA:carnitine CoA-transferase CaiB-like acyl-CoA transferase
MAVSRRCRTARPPEVPVPPSAPPLGPGPLAGTRVVDLTRARSGPTCARQLADLGADVVQVLDPRRGDLGGSDAHNLHRSKRSIVADLHTAEGREVVLRLVDRADVLLENWRPAVKHRLGLGPDELLVRNPRLVVGSISGFGQDGPYADRPGVDQIAQGLGGLMSVTGPPGTGPWRAGIAISDTASGTFLTIGVVSALLARATTGRGQWVCTSLLESMINLMDFQAARWLVDGEVAGQAGNDHPTIFPMGTFATADGYVNIAAAPGFDRFCRAIDGEHLLADPRFADATARRAHRDELVAECEVLLGRRTTAEWVTILNDADLPCGPVLALDEVFADPQVRHLRMTTMVEHERDGTVELVRLPLTFSETPATVRSAAPVPGADTRAVLAELGYADDEVDALVAAGAVAERWSAPSW